MVFTSEAALFFFSRLDSLLLPTNIGAGCDRNVDTLRGPIGGLRGSGSEAMLSAPKVSFLPGPSLIAPGGKG